MAQHVVSASHLFLFKAPFSNRYEHPDPAFLDHLFWLSGWQQDVSRIDPARWFDEP
jgi:hypothetical protein